MGMFMKNTNEATGDRYEKEPMTYDGFVDYEEIKRKNKLAFEEDAKHRAWLEAQFPGVKIAPSFKPHADENDEYSSETWGKAI